MLQKYQKLLKLSYDRKKTEIFQLRIFRMPWPTFTITLIDQLFLHQYFSNDMKRIALPVTNKLLSEYFGKCNHYEIFEIDGNVVGRHNAVMPEGISPDELPSWLEKQGITDVISFKVDSQIIHFFSSRKVNLFVGVPQEEPGKLVEAWLEGRLESDEKIINEITRSKY